VSLLLLLRGGTSAPTISAPTNARTPYASGIAQVGQIVSGTVGGWRNNPTSFSFQWQSAATFGGSYTNIGAATSQTYTPVIGDLGKFLRVVVTATNSAGSASANSNPVGAVIAANASLTQHVAANRPALLYLLDLAATSSGVAYADWRDITQYVRDSIQTQRGRQNALDKIEGGTGSFPVDNYDRSFEPEYAAGQFYPNIVPERRNRLLAVYGGVIYSLHFGYVQTWPMTWPGLKRSRTAIGSADGFEVLNGNQLTQLFPAALSGAMINAILDAAGWDPALRRIDTGTEMMLGIDAQGASALDLLQNVADSEYGLFFIAGDGYAVFHDRDHRIVAARSTTTQATFGDGAPGTGELPYLDPATDFDVTRIYNSVEVDSGLATPTPTIAVDAASKLQYGPRSLSRSTILQTDGAANDQATRILRENKDPRLRFPAIVLDPMRNPLLWPVVLGLEISDRVVVNRRPYSGGAMISKTMWVESIQHAIALGPPFGWRTTLALSLADGASYWTLNSSTKSVLDSTTVLR
jgi:hypothetical protein